MPMGDNKYPGDSWLARYRARVNADQEMSVIGDWFTTALTLTLGDERHALRIETGKIAEIIRRPGHDVRTMFGFRSPPFIRTSFATVSSRSPTASTM